MPSGNPERSACSDDAQPEDMTCAACAYCTSSATRLYCIQVEARLVQSTNSYAAPNADVENTTRWDAVQAPNVLVPGRMSPPDRLELLDCRFSLVHAFNHRTTASDPRFRLLLRPLLSFFLFPSSLVHIGVFGLARRRGQSWAGRPAKR